MFSGVGLISANGGSATQANAGSGGMKTLRHLSSLILIDIHRWWSYFHHYPYELIHGNHNCGVGRFFERYLQRSSWNGLPLLIVPRKLHSTHLKRRKLGIENNVALQHGTQILLLRQHRNHQIRNICCRFRCSYQYQRDNNIRVVSRCLRNSVYWWVIGTSLRSDPPHFKRPP